MLSPPHAVCDSVGADALQRHLLRELRDNLRPLACGRRPKGHLRPEKAMRRKRMFPKRHCCSADDVVAQHAASNLGMVIEQMLSCLEPATFLRRLEASLSPCYLAHCRRAYKCSLRIQQRRCLEVTTATNARHTCRPSRPGHSSTRSMTTSFSQFLRNCTLMLIPKLRSLPLCRGGQAAAGQRTQPTAAPSPPQPRPDMTLQQLSALHPITRFECNTHSDESRHPV